MKQLLGILTRYLVFFSPLEEKLKKMLELELVLFLESSKGVFQ